MEDGRGGVVKGKSKCAVTAYTKISPKPLTYVFENVDERKFKPRG